MDKKAIIYISCLVALIILIAAILMLIYIAIRFEWKKGVMAVAALAINILVMLSVYAICKIPLSTTFIAAILTVLGYSINDTIVIFDRIRENKAIYNKDNNEKIIDMSLNQTLNRTIMTSLTTLVVMVPLCIMVSASIREFIIPLMVGVIVGCLSSIFMCSPLYYDLCRNEEESKYLKNSKKTNKFKKFTK